MNESFEIQFWDDPYQRDMIAHDDGDNHKGYDLWVIFGQISPKNDKFCNFLY